MPHAVVFQYYQTRQYAKSRETRRMSDGHAVCTVNVVQVLMLHVVLLKRTFPVAGTDELHVAEHSRSLIDTVDRADDIENG